MFFFFYLNDFKCIEKLREYYDEYPVTHLDLEFVIFWPYRLHLHFFQTLPICQVKKQRLGSVPSEGERLREEKQCV